MELSVYRIEKRDERNSHWQWVFVLIRNRGGVDEDIAYLRDEGLANLVAVFLNAANPIK